MLAAGIEHAVPGFEPVPGFGGGKRHAPLTQYRDYKN
jgi:hypothetical protein